MKIFRTQRRKRTSTMEKSSLCYNKKKRKLNGFSSFEKKTWKKIQTEICNHHNEYVYDKRTCDKLKFILHPTKENKT